MKLIVEYFLKRFTGIEDSKKLTGMETIEGMKKQGIVILKNLFKIR